jgi:hypothetical protein
MTRTLDPAVSDLLTQAAKPALTFNHASGGHPVLDKRLAELREVVAASSAEDVPFAIVLRT